MAMCEGARGDSAGQTGAEGRAKNGAFRFAARSGLTLRAIPQSNKMIQEP